MLSDTHFAELARASKGHLWHRTDLSPEHAKRQGLVPGSPSDYPPALAPRPRCIYLTVPRPKPRTPSIARYVYRVALEALDPALFLVDEDNWFQYEHWSGGVSPYIPVPLNRPPSVQQRLSGQIGRHAPGPGAGEWVDLHTAQLDTSEQTRASAFDRRTGSVAYRGHIPPNALTGVDTTGDWPPDAFVAL